MVQALQSDPVKDPTELDSQLDEKEIEQARDSQNYKFAKVTLRKHCVSCDRVTGHHVTNTPKGVPSARICTKCHLITVNTGPKSIVHPEPQGTIQEWITKNPRFGKAVSKGS